MSASPMRRARRWRPRRGQSRLGLWTGLLLGLLALCYLGALELSRPHVGGDTLSFGTLVRTINEDRVRSATLLDEDAYIVGRYQREDKRIAEFNSPLLRGTQSQILDLLIVAEVEDVEVDPQVGKRVATLASVLLPGLILIVLFVYLILSYRRGTGLFGVRSGARRITADVGGVTFAEVAGQDAAVAELREITDFLSDPDRYAEVGAVIPKGVLLYGPPGCGKTLLARALAGEAGAAFYSISGSDFVELYAGVGAARVRDLFREARENAPAIIFIDELDSIGRTRSGAGVAVSHGEQEQGLNQILAEMDGFSATSAVIVVAATNRADVLDPALLRPGRFDRAVGLERPGEAARFEILSLHARRKPLDPDVDLQRIARKASGLSGADLASVMNEGALLAGRHRKATISQTDLEQALQRIIEAPDRQRRLSLRQRTVGKRFSDEDRVTFADVAGVDAAIEELADVKEYLASPDRFTKVGARVPRGILLTGPPGCGKTLLARAVAGEANAAFFSVAGSEFVEVFVGEGAARVRDLFSEARAVAPAIIFIDEIDAVGGHRATSSFGGGHEREQTLNQVLVELDGFGAADGLVVIAATNRPDMLDSALVRPGRFDRTVVVASPDRAGRLAILQVHARDKPLGDDVSLDAIAGLTRGFTGADLANILNEAALLAARRDLDTIPMAVVDESLDRVMLGLLSRGTIMTDEERSSVAVHEAGHFLVAHTLPSAVPPHKVSILPRGGTLGHCSMVDTHDRVLFTRERLIDRMATLLGGRAAEEVALGELASGATSDLRRASELARQMVSAMGMSPTLGPVVFDGEPGAGGGRPRLSEEAASLVDAEVRALVELAYGRAVRVVTERSGDLATVAGALLEKETLSAIELEGILAGGARNDGSQVADLPQA